MKVTDIGTSIMPLGAHGHSYSCMQCEQGFCIATWAYALQKARKHFVQNLIRTLMRSS